MSFVSPAFFALLLPVVALFYALPARHRVAYLLVVSYAIYWTWSPHYLALLAACTLAVHLVAARIAASDSDARKRSLLGFGVVLLCALLTLFKLDAAFGAALRARLPLPALLMPLGLSYYLFRLISYLIEVYWDAGAREPSLVRFAAYVAFFPQIVSGPIQRSFEFLPQLDEPAFSRFDGARLEAGGWLILRGLFQKLVIADRLALFVAELDAHPEGHTRALLVLASYAYTLQIFVDFAGFTNLVMGIGQLFGIVSPPNFNHPFAASNIQDFWRRWHMSLTRWLGDYVFTPLRMRLRTWGNRGLVLSILINMVLIGLWHGISTGFLSFGIVHGVFMSVSALTLRRRDRLFATRPALAPLRRVGGAFVTFNLVAFAQIFFRLPTFSDGMHLLGLMARPLAPGTQPLSQDLWLPSLACGVAALLLGTGLAERAWKPLRARTTLPDWLGYAVMLMAILLLSSTSGGQFIYFKF